MLAGLMADAAFCAAVFFETLATLSILSTAYPIQLREELDPILVFYHAHVTPSLAWTAIVVPGKVPPWFPDAYLIAAILFFLFFIAQARKAMAPYEEDTALIAAGGEPNRFERAIDWLLPPIACALGALVSAVTLLPLLTFPIALWIAGRMATGRPTWFKISRSYFVNVIAVVMVTALILALPR